MCEHTIKSSESIVTDNMNLMTSSFDIMANLSAIKRTLCSTVIEDISDDDKIKN